MPHALNAQQLFAFADPQVYFFAIIIKLGQSLLWFLLQKMQNKYRRSEAVFILDFTLTIGQGYVCNIYM